MHWLQTGAGVGKEEAHRGKSTDGWGDDRKVWPRSKATTWKAACWEHRFGNWEYVNWGGSLSSPCDFCIHNPQKCHYTASSAFKSQWEHDDSVGAGWGWMMYQQKTIVLLSTSSPQDTQTWCDRVLNPIIVETFRNEINSDWINIKSTNE